MPEMEGAAAVAERVEASESAEVVETGTQGAGEAETGAETGQEAESAAQQTDSAAKPAGKSKLNLAEVAKTSLEALKAINPVLPAAMKAAAFELSGLYREFPGGLKEAVALREAFSGFGGAEGVKELQSAVSDYGKLEQQFEKGDPGFITSLADASPASFSQIMPAGLEKWKQVDPQGFDHSVARAIVDTLAPAKVAETLATIHNAIDPEKGKEVRAELARLYELFEGIKATSEKAPERKANPDDERLSQREQELAQREMKALLHPIATEGRQQIQGIVDREMGQNFQWDKTDPDVKQAVADRVRQDVVAASEKDAAFKKEFERLKARGDAAGLSRHVKNFQDRVTPGIVQRTARLFNVKAKAAAATSAARSAAGARPAAAAERGWEAVAKMPSSSQIDYPATAAEAKKQRAGSSAEDLIMANKAVLKDKRKVAWA